MEVHEGSRIVIEGVKVGQARRSGEVLRVEHERLWVRWDDGHETMFMPGPDAHVEEGRHT